jgi:hypothetical protein
MGYFTIVFLLAAGAVIFVGWGSIRRRRREVIGSAIIYQTDRNW